MLVVRSVLCDTGLAIVPCSLRSCKMYRSFSIRIFTLCLCLNLFIICFFGTSNLKNRFVSFGCSATMCAENSGIVVVDRTFMSCKG